VKKLSNGAISSGEKIKVLLFKSIAAYCEWLQVTHLYNSIFKQLRIHF
jgi:hypothetical protein